MPRRLAALFLVGLAVLHAQAPTFRSGVQTVAIYATVQDRAGRLAPDLDKEDFQILEDGRPRDITVFSRDPQPLSVAMMLDESQTMCAFGTREGVTAAMQPIRSSIDAFLNGLGTADRLSLGSFGLEIAVGANLTRDRQELARVLDEEMWCGGGTPLWQALSTAMTSLAHAPSRHVVLVFTDGRDTGHLPGWKGNQQTIERQAAAEDAMVYAVRPNAPMAPEDEKYRLSREMEHVAESTGGGHVNVPRGSDIAAAFGQIAAELRHQYAIGFAPASHDGAEHTIDVRLTKTGLTARARKSYVASR